MDGIERIKILASEIIDEDLKKITDYLITRTDMNEKYLNEEKSIKQMVTFINDTAKKQLSKKKQSGFVGQFINDETVFGWAIHYWDESNKSLGIKSEEELKKENAERIKHNKEQMELRKQQLKEQKVTRKKQEETIKEDSKEVVEKVEPIKESKPKWVPEGQLTLF